MGPAKQPIEMPKGRPSAIAYRYPTKWPNLLLGCGFDTGNVTRFSMCAQFFSGLPNRLKIWIFSGTHEPRNQLY